MLLEAAQRPKKVTELLEHVPASLDSPIVTKAEVLHELCDRLASAGSFAFDTEFIMEEGYQPEVCLIQVATESEAALIDPLSGLDTAVFWELVANPSVEVVVHAGMEDLALCRQLIEKTPSNVFDIQIAAGLLRHDYPMSLSRLVYGVLRIRLHKSQTLTDWRRRPLSEAQRKYATDDVAYIPAVHRRLTEALQRRGRTAWAREEFSRFESIETYEPAKQTRLFKVKGTGSLKPRQLAVVSELLDARDELAKKLNRPARVVLRDHLLVEIARHGWTHPKEIQSLRGLQLRSWAVDRLAEAVKCGLARPSAACPAPAATVEETPEEIALVSLLTAVLRDFCRSRKIAFGLMATKQSIRALLHAHTRGALPTSLLQRGWRAEVTGKMLSDLLSGRATVKIVGSGARTRLRVQGRAE